LLLLLLLPLLLVLVVLLNGLFQLNVGVINDVKKKLVNPLEVFQLRSKLMNHFQSYRLTLSEEERDELDGKLHLTHFVVLLIDFFSFSISDAWGFSFNDTIFESERDRERPVIQTRSIVCFADNLKKLKKLLGFLSISSEENLFSDLHEVLQQVLQEDEFFKSHLLSEREKEKRLMFAIYYLD
jgi:hypothetical protein